GLRPALGRTFLSGEDEPGKDRLVVLSWGLWQRRFGGDSDVLGTIVSINGIPRTIIGVMPEAVRYPAPAEMWAPYAPTLDTWTRRRLHYLYVTGRLAPGVTLEQARAELTRVSAGLAAQYPATNRDWRTNVQPLVREAAQGIEPMLLVLMAAVGFVLLIACANVANLMLARATDSPRSGATAGGRERHRLRRALVGTEVALALLLLIGAGLTFRTFRHLGTLDPGFDARGVALTSLALPGRSYEDGPAAVRFYSRLVERATALPGVLAAGAANVVPLCGCNQTSSFNVVGQPPYGIGERPDVDWRVITPGYFAALRVPVRRGRDFAATDAAAAPSVVIVNETLARRWFPDGALGKRLIIEGDTARPAAVVGIVADMRHAGLAQEALPEMFLPEAQRPVWEMTLAVRTAGGDPAATALLPALRAAVLEIDP